MVISRVKYFIYYLLRLDKAKFQSFLNYAAYNSGKSRIWLVADSFSAVFIYNISILEYFYFRFYEKSKNERLKWAGTGYMYEYQLLMNPMGERNMLENKITFLNHFKDLIKRFFLPISGKPDELAAVASLLKNDTGFLVLKGSLGQVGSEVEIIKCGTYTPESLIYHMRKEGYDLIEEYVIQHPDLNDLSPSGLNTIRVITQVQNDKFFILGARLRISVNSPVDNMAAGNLAAPVDLETGIVNGPAVFSDITKEQLGVHPVTGKSIIGFQVPYWSKVLELAETAARMSGGNRSIGWDIAVTPDGPELIEGNHNWCKLLWQLPVNKGLKEELVKYL